MKAAVARNSSQLFWARKTILDSLIHAQKFEIV